MARCLECKIKFKPVKFLQKYCKGNDECLTAEALYLLDKMKKVNAKKVKDNKKQEREKDKVMKIEVYSKENKKLLQSEINKLCRMIDNKFNYKCIDCDQPFGNQTDGAHFTSVGANTSTRFHLHNIHAARAYCNQYSDVHKEGYIAGLEKRYGEEYLKMVEGLPLKYPLVKLSNVEIHEKLTIVRKLVRTFDTYKFENAISARSMFNKIIGIYD